MFLVSVGVVVSSAEYLADSAQLKDTGLMSWTIGRLREPVLSIGRIGELLNVALGYPGVLGLLFLRLVVAGLLVADIAAGVERGELFRASLLLMAALITMLFLVRSKYGHDGADQMALLVLLSLGLGSAVGTPVAVRACLWFITLQACLAYATAGIAKASSGGWRDGSFLRDILSTRMYGHARVGSILRNRSVLSRCCALGVIAWECLFPLVLVTPYPHAIGFLIIGAIFHLTSAYLMGLNTFTWSFLSTYPAIIYCVGTLR